MVFWGRGNANLELRLVSRNKAGMRKGNFGKAVDFVAEIQGWKVRRARAPQPLKCMCQEDNLETQPA